MVLPYPNIHILNNHIIPLSCPALSTIWNPTYMHTIISKNLPTISTPSMRFMLGAGTEIVGRFRLFPSVRDCVLPGAIWFSAMHTFSHTFIFIRSWSNHFFEFNFLLDFLCLLIFLRTLKIIKRFRTSCVNYAIKTIYSLSRRLLFRSFESDM